MRIIAWVLRALLFFTLFAFALNNLQPATVNWFFGLQSRAPLVIVVLVAFVLGSAVGVLAMVPAWWRSKRLQREQQAPAAERPAGGSEDSALPGAALDSSITLPHPPREGL